MKKGYSIIKQTKAGKIWRLLTFILAVNTLSLNAQYCSPGSNCNSGDLISYFGLKTITNPSGCSGGGYGDYTSITAPSLFIGQTYPVRISTSYGNAGVAFWIDYNDDFTFDATERAGYTLSSLAGGSTTDINITISASATAGTHRLRARLIFQETGSNIDPCNGYTYGETEDYLVNLVVFPPCTGIPNAGDAASTSTAICTGSSFDLSLINNTENEGLDYQWQSSADGVAWSDLASVQHNILSPVTINSLNATTYYHCVVTCTSSAQSATSTPVIVNKTPFINCYCIPSSSWDCSGDKFTNFSIANLVGEATACNGTGFIDSTASNYKAINLTAGNTYTLLTNIITSGSDGINANVGAWIDFDQNGIFDGSEHIYLGYGTAGTYSNTLTVPLFSQAGTVRMRMALAKNYGNALTPCSTSGWSFGQFIDYKVNIIAAPVCSGMPNPGNAVSTLTTVCSNTSFNLSLNNYTTGNLGLNFQWQSSPDGSTWTNFGSVQNDIPSPANVSSINATTYYQCITTCSASAQSATSTPVIVNKTALINCYCTPLSSWNCSGDKFTDFSIANLVGEVTACNGNGFIDSTASNYKTINLSAGNTYTLLTNTINSGVFGNGNATMGAWIDYDQNGNFDGNEFISLGYGAAGTYSNTLTVPLLAQTGTVKIRLELAPNGNAALDPCNNNNGWYYGQIIDYKVNITAAPLCSGTPSLGNAVSTASVVCPSTAYDLSLTGNDLVSGLSYQWQSSPDGSTWADVGSSQNTIPYTVSSQTTTTHYRCVATCTNGGATGTSNPVVVNQKLMDCYCTPSYSWNCTGDKFTDFSIANVVAQISNCDANGFSDSTASNYTTINLNAANTYTLLVNTINSGSYGDAAMGAWIDYNQNGSFDSNEFISLGYGAAGTYSNTLTVPLLTESGTVRMRLKLDNYYAWSGTFLDPCNNNNGASNGQIIDYKVNITAAPLCSGTPSLGTAISSLGSVCSFNSYTLDLTGNDLVTGLTYQWQSSPDGSIWADVGSSQNTIPYTVSSQTTTTHYRCVATCTNGGATGTSNPVIVNQNLPTACYCVPEALNCSTSYVSNVMIENINHSPSCNAGSNGYQDNTVSVSSASLSAHQSYTISASLNCQGGPGYVGVWIDFNKNGLFDNSEYTHIGTTSFGTVTGTLNIPFTAIGGDTRMRLKMESTYSTYDGYSLDPCYADNYYGQTLDYLLNITPVTTCSGTPNPGNIVAPASVCMGNPFTLDLTGNDIVSGATYQWYSSPDGTTYTALGGGPQTTVPYVVSTQTTTTYYMCTVFCPASGMASSSPATTITVNSFSVCYCVPPPTDCSNNDEIQNVTIETINNTSTCSISNGYTDYTPDVATITATVQAAKSYTMDVTLGYSYNENVSVWIDYDQNGSFDASEYTFLGSSQGSGNNLVTGTISIPSSVTPGITRMRVRNLAGISLADVDACNSPSGGGSRMSSIGTGFNPMGETEDYLITLLPPDCDNINYAPSYTVTGGVNICPGQSTVLDITPPIQTAVGITYQWKAFDGTAYTNEGTASAVSAYTATPTTNTLYYCEVQCHTNPVANSNTITVNVNAITTAPATTSVSCNGLCDGSATLNASTQTGTLSYTWAPSGPTADMAVALCAGIYTVNVSNSTGCTVTETFTITEPAAITATVTQTDVSCFGLADATASVTVTGGISPYTYSWSPTGGNSSTTSALTPGNYSLMISDANSCNIIETFTITEPALLTATVSNVIGSCLGGSNGQAEVQVSGGTTAYTYSWTSGGTNALASNLAIGSYSCTITDAHLCTITETVSITQVAANFSVSITGKGGTSVCEQIGDTIVSTVTGGSGSFSYGWVESPTNATSTNPNFTHTTSIGTYSYNLAVVDNSNNCVVSSNTFTNQVNPSSNLSGTVTTYPSLPVAGRVVLYKYLPFLTKFDSVAGQNIGAAGDYNFVSFTSGTYIIKAIPNSNNLQVAYGDSAYNWKTARQINHGCAVNDVQNIKVRALTTFVQGPGLLSGVITETVGYGQRNWASGSTNEAFRPTVPGTPIGGIVVKGGRNPGGQMFVQTVTDPMGQYTLAGLPLNTGGPNDEYFVLVDIPGLDTNNTYHRTITPGNTTFTNLDFVVDSIYITPLQDPNVSVHDLSAKEHKIKVFPNPASNYVTIQYDLQNSSLVKIELFDILGKSVKMLLPLTEQSIDTYKTSWQLDDLKAGLYFIKMTINGTESTIKLSVSK